MTRFDDPDRHRHRPRHGPGRAHSERSDAPSGEGPPSGDASDDSFGEGPLGGDASDDSFGEGPLGGDAPEPGPVPLPRPGQLSGEARRRLQAARLWVAFNRPYYSKALFSCPVIPAAAPARISIDERWRIYASSEFLESLTVEQAASELIHVLNHVLRDHARRARSTGVDAVAAAAWNAAADCEINDDLLEDDLLDDDPPDGSWLLPEDLDLADYCTAEHYFRDILDGAVSVEARTGCGSGCHSHFVDHELVDGTDALGDFDRALLKRAVANAVTDHLRHLGAGSVPAGLVRWAQQTLNPKVNWRQQLATALRSSVHHRSGAADYTWKRPSRRQQPQDPVLRPAMTRPVPSITVVVDTSGSMSEHELDRALTEIRAIIAAVVPGDSVRVLSVDTDIQSDQRIHDTSEISLAGSGGTDMAAGIATAAEARPDAVVVITDGYTTWPLTRLPGAGCVIAALTERDALRWVPDWIQAIDMSEHFDA